MKVTTTVTFQLEEKCDDCEMERAKSKQSIAHIEKCENCGGRGTLLTSNGRELVEFLNKHFKPKGKKRK